MRVSKLLAVFLILGSGLAFGPAFSGVGNLARLGVKTVLDLREDPAQASAEERLVRAAGMRFVSIPMLGLSKPTDDQIARALAILTDDAAVPVFVHCRRGADRTGTVIACYRIALDHGRRRGLLSGSLIDLSVVHWSPSPFSRPGE